MSMLSHPDFSPRDWDCAPQYPNPIDVPKAVLLDFAALSEIAEQEEANGSFHWTPDGTLAKAPLILGDLPAAFYKVDANHPRFTPNHNTVKHETIVVIEGILRLVYNYGGDRDAAESQAGTATTGEVIELSHEPVSMQAIGLPDPSSVLALAIFRGYDEDVRPDFHISG